MKKTFITCEFLTVLLAFAVVSASARTGVGDQIASACGKCHDTDRVCKMVGVKDAAAWRKTIDRMIKRGAQLSPATAGPAAEYLDSLAPGTGPVCQ
jgi:hypothetical protein